MQRLAWYMHVQRHVHTKADRRVATPSATRPCYWGAQGTQERKTATARRGTVGSMNSRAKLVADVCCCVGGLRWSTPLPSSVGASSVGIAPSVPPQIQLERNDIRQKFILFFWTRCEKRRTLFEGATGVRPRMSVEVPCRITASFGSSNIKGVFSDNEKTVDLSSGEILTRLSCWMDDTGRVILVASAGRARRYPHHRIPCIVPSAGRARRYPHRRIPCMFASAGRARNHRIPCMFASAGRARRCPYHRIPCIVASAGRARR